MWMSELAARSGVPVPTVKYYLREGLLPPGEATGATRAIYSEDHVRRLRLIRALVEVGGLRLADVNRVLAAVDDSGTPLHEVLGVAQSAISPVGPSPSARSLERVDALIRRRRWRVAPDSVNRTVLARALDALDDADDALPDDALSGYAETVSGLAEVEVPTIDTTSSETAVRQTVLRTVLIEPVLLALRRMAHEHVSSRALRRRR
ncbi:MerR family transcriptional regulator [Nocardioides sp.]|uniref:MerR family transcriptional regulator n=1 Tax=Nocardioides sp. TaxID=35761 RepID=UPI002ED05A9C